MKQIEIYQDPSGRIELEVHIENETIWLTQRQMAELFETSSQNITMHLKSIFVEEELEENSTCKEFLHVQQEGKRVVKRRQLQYSLDAIIAVGYRVKSKRATQFRIWANQIVKDYLIQGYAINQKRLAQKEQEVKILRSGIQILGRAIEQKAEEAGLEWLDTFARGLELLDDYDHESLDEAGITIRETIYPPIDEYYSLVEKMCEAFDSDVFGKEKDSNFQSSITQISKGVGNEDFYSSLEEKAAMLLYFITKNHSFVDGNKRIAAACFLLFLDRNELLFKPDKRPIISNEALAALTLYVASSKPEEMELVKRLIISVLNRNQK